MTGFVDAIAAAAGAARRGAGGAPTRARQIATAGGHPRGALALVLSILMVGSVIVAPLAAAGLATAQDDPRGLESVPDDNFDARESAIPSNALENVPTHASAWDVHASAHARDLETTVDTTGDQLKLVFTDDRNHQGREVAVDADALEQSLGERPEIAFGVHESGDRWSSAIEYRDGMAIWTIPKFSDNEVTFEGTVGLTGNPATDGTSYTYELADSEDVSDFSITLTGNEHRKNETASDTNAADGSSVPYSVDGTTEPEKATVSLTGSVPADAGAVNWETDVGGSRTAATDGITVASGNNSGYVHGLDTTGTLEWETNPHSDAVNVVKIGSHVYSGSRDNTVVATETDGSAEAWTSTVPGNDVLDLAPTSGTVYGGGHDAAVWAIDTADGSQKWSVSTPTDSVRGVAYDPDNHVVYAVEGTDFATLRAYNATDGSELWSTSYSDSEHATDLIFYEGTIYATSWGGTLRAFDTSGSEVWSVASEGGGSYIRLTASDGYLIAEQGGEIEVHDTADGRHVWGEAYPNGGGIAVDGTNVYIGGGGSNDEVIAANWETESEDPSVAIDGTTVLSHSGYLENGKTISTSVSVSLGDNTLDVSTVGGTVVDPAIEIEEITETVDPSVTVNGDTYSYAGTLADGETTSLDPSTVSLQSGENVVDVAVSTDYSGPAGQVGLDYSHTATDTQSVDYEGETYSERYNVSKTYASDRTGETLSIPWSGNVIDVRDLELRRDGGSWTTPTYSMSDGTLEVEIGSVSAGETIDVRTTGTKVDTRNGAITVTDPTVLGDDLSSEIRIDDYADGFEIAVGGTIAGNETHYTHSESWSNPQSYARVGADGSQALRMPNAGAGETARISTIPLEPNPQDGNVDLRVRSAGSEPEFEVLDSSSTSEVELVWYDTTSGSTYQLFSLTADAEVDRATANSPVSLIHDGSAEVLAIYDLGSGSGGPAAAGGTSTADTPPTMLIALALAGLLAIYLVSRRMGDDSVSGGMVLVAGSVLVGILSIQAMAPGILARAIGAGLESTLPILIMGAIAIIIVWLRSRGDDVTLQLGDRP